MKFVTALPLLPSHKFQMDQSAKHQGIPHTDVFGLGEDTVMPGWSAVGWCPNAKLMYQREDELGEGASWIGVRYEHEDGRVVWFHRMLTADDASGSDEVPL